MPTVTANDGTTISYKDWGSGQPVVFSHGWPLNADSWEAQMLFLASNSCRCIGHDRRGHGRSGQPWDGNEMDTYADDLATLIETLDLRGVVLVGFSTGGGEVARYIGRYGTERVAGAALVSAVPPLMLKTDDNPGGVPIEVFDGLRAESIADRAQLYRDLADGPSSATTVPERPSRRVCGTPSGGRACSRGTATRTSASPRSRPRTSEVTSRSSTCRHSSFTETTIRSCHSKSAARHPPVSSKGQRSRSFPVLSTASPTRIRSS
jgi:pimeloyl-ACP methyl ester carboxylesterase